jgi:hypothetical protein
MAMTSWIFLGGLHSLGFALFHLAFWRLFGWPRTLQATTPANRAVLQIANVQLVFVFLAVAALCFLHGDALVGTPLGRAFLLGMSLFWVVRLLSQFIWLRINRPLVHALSALFALGALLFAMPLLA